MQQYEKAKAACGDALLFFRMGDFYELFHDDARKAAKLLGLTLTARDKASKVPMAGFPHHQLDGYMGKLIKLGLRVAVCEQVEDPKDAKGLVKREISQIVSPGTVADEALLDPAESNYLAAVAFPSGSKRKSKQAGANEDLVGVAWAELSTGRFFTTAVPPCQLTDLLARIAPKEILVGSSCRAKLDELPLDSLDSMLTDRPDWGFGFQTATELLKQQFDVASLDGFGLEPFGPTAVAAAGAIIEYLRETQRNSVEHFNSVLPFRQSQFMEVDSATWRSLELSRTIRHGSREGSLLGVIDRSRTPMGSRLLGEWISNPLTDLSQIARRHDAVGELVDNAALRSNLREYLGEVFDLQRLLSKVATGRAAPRDISCVGKTLAALPALKAKLAGRESQWLCQLEAELDLCVDLRAEIEAALIDPCPAQLKDAGFVREGYDSRLDELRALAAGGKQWIAKYQQTICEQTGIPSLKVGFNKVFGYYLEVTHAHRDKVPDDFIRKQTLKNAERFITPELKEYEEKVLSADEQAQALEHQLFHSLRELVKAHTSRLKSNAEIIATLDTLTGLAQLASEQGYCRPTMVTEEQTHIVEGRHPVLDIVEPLGAFIPNDTHCCPPAEHTQPDQPSGFLHLITGPNMAGKSTYIRQVALISLMGQVGSFVPAKSATLGIVDKIFARVGASDELARGQSTFMVEMTETARILNTATKRSLVILDEIGRGTSTYDGVSLAWAIVEFLHDSIGCRTLFATHYHELTRLEQNLDSVANYNVAVKEWEDKIVFLHKIVPGGADRSYGIHVSRLAGVPNWVNQRAEQILEKLESDSDVQRNQEAISSTDKSSASGSENGQIQLTMFGMEPHPLIDKIRSLQPTEMTPMNALEMLHQWQQELTDPVDSDDPAVAK